MIRLHASLLVALLLAPAGGVRAELESHRAIYRLDLGGRSHASSVVGVDGGLLIEWRRACDRWLSHQRLAFVAVTDEGGELRHEIGYSSWETLDGSRLGYVVRSLEDGEPAESYRGEAWLGPDAEARFTSPPDETVRLPAGTIFPTEHLRQVIEGARAGERFVSHLVFDGWGLDALTQITSVIGAPQTVPPSAEGRIPGAATAWPVSMAYYGVESDDDTPEFEASFLLAENGVLYELRLDYGDFQLEATLTELEMLPPAGC